MNDDEAVQLLADLVSIPSFTGSERQAVEFFVETLARAGLETCIDEVGNGIARTPPSSRRLTFLGHIDTVSGHVPERIENDRLYGRGAVDAKGPLAAAMVTAIRSRSTPGIEVIAAVGEEGPSHGARHLTAQAAPEALIIGEPSGADSIVLGYKGSMRATLRFSAPLAHSAGSEQSIADVAIDAWIRIREVCRELSLGFTNFETLTPALLDIQTSSDGLTATASLSASFRLPPSLDIETAQSRIAEASGSETVQFGPADAAFQSPKTTKLVGSLVRSIREEQTQPRFKHKTGTSDMNVVGPVWGCPAVAYGPGDSSLDHTPNEHIALDEYLRGIRVLTRVFQEWNPC